MCSDDKFTKFRFLILCAYVVSKNKRSNDVDQIHTTWQTEEKNVTRNVHMNNRIENHIYCAGNAQQQIKYQQNDVNKIAHIMRHTYAQRASERVRPGSMRNAQILWDAALCLRSV